MEEIIIVNPKKDVDDKEILKTQLILAEKDLKAINSEIETLKKGNLRRFVKYVANQSFN
jgi:hypothetical protein